MKNKSSLMMAVLCSLLFLTSPNSSSGQENAKAVDPYFWAMYQKALALNADHFPDVNRIPVGAVVLMPMDLETDRLWLFIAQEPVNGTHDCIWRFTEQVIAMQINDDDIEPPSEPDVLPEDPADSVDIIKRSWGEVITILAAIVVLIALGMIIYLIGNYLRRRNPDAHPPVIPEGLNEDPLVALQQISALQPEDNRVPRLVENGIFIRHYGPKEIPVVMQFADHPRAVDVRPSDSAVRVTYTDNSVSVYRNKCGNQVNQIYGGQEGPIRIPEG